MRAPLAFAVFLGFAVSGHASPSTERAAEVLSCVLTVEPVSQVYRIPAITVALTNQTDADIYLVGSLDASDCKWRYPHCYFEVIGPNGKPASGTIDRCGNMNSLREADFVRVPPGGTFDPYRGNGGFSANQIRPYTFRVPGKYRIRFFYSTASEVIAEWAGDGRQGLAELLSLVPKVEVASNEVEVEVELVGGGERQ